MISVLVYHSYAVKKFLRLSLDTPPPSMLDGERAQALGTKASKEKSTPEDKPPKEETK